MPPSDFSRWVEEVQGYARSVQAASDAVDAVTFAIRSLPQTWTATTVSTGNVVTTSDCNTAVADTYWFWPASYQDSWGERLSEVEILRRRVAELEALLAQVLVHPVLVPVSPLEEGVRRLRRPVDVS